MISVIAEIIMLPWKRRALYAILNLHSHAAAVSYVSSYPLTIPNQLYAKVLTIAEVQPNTCKVNNLRGARVQCLINTDSCLPYIDLLIY